MSDQHFLKCNCQSCGDSIEFPAHGAGLEIACPHCGQKTLLSESAETLVVTGQGRAGVSPALAAHRPDTEAPAAPGRRDACPPQPMPGKKSPLLAGTIALVVLGALAGGIWYFMAGPGAKKPEEPVAKMAPTIPATNPPAHGPEPTDVADAPAPPPAPKNLKSIDDLKPGAVTLEKAKSGNLVHAVGTIKNASDQQRFGVRVELELSDANGNPAGRASDYTQVIEPRQEWRFRALVLDPKGSRAVAGKVSSIKEDN